VLDKKGKHSMKLKVTRSTGNVFRDIGFSADEAEHLKVRSDLLIHLQKVISARGLKQAQAAKLLGVSQPRVSDLMCGRIELFSIDTLIDMLANMGIRVKVVLKHSTRRAAVG
jgi:predicted XRE-type DNA-binding protein